MHGGALVLAIPDRCRMGEWEAVPLAAGSLCDADTILTYYDAKSTVASTVTRGAGRAYQA
jgi:hypothetical protein